MTLRKIDNIRIDHLIARDPPGSRGSTRDDRPEAPDRIDYIADLILELWSMTEPTKCYTLSGILEVAYREALFQSRQRREAGR